MPPGPHWLRPTLSPRGHHPTQAPLPLPCSSRLARVGLDPESLPGPSVLDGPQATRPLHHLPCSLHTPLGSLWPSHKPACRSHLFTFSPKSRCCLCRSAPFCLSPCEGLALLCPLGNPACPFPPFLAQHARALCGPGRGAGRRMGRAPSGSPPVTSHHRRSEPPDWPAGPFPQW